MNKFIFLLALLFVGFTGHASDTCYHFKTGHFMYRDSVGTSVSINRTKSQQTEENKQTGLRTRSKISWVGECSYRLTQTWANQKEARKNNGRQLVIHITHISGNEYTYSCDCADGSALRGTVIKISD